MLLTRAPTLSLGSCQHHAAARRCQASSQPFRTHFLGGPVSAATLHCSFAGLSLRSQGQVRAPRRGSVLVEANSKTGLGITKRGSRRARTRTSGFRARMQTPNGRLVLKARRKKGRKTLCPANNYRK